MPTRPISGPPIDADQWLLRRALVAGDAQFDQQQRLLAGTGSATSVHTWLTGQPVHPYRESATYALILLESGAVDRAAGVLTAVLAGQDHDRQSETYGVWPYYLEEPLAAMRRPDYNWADFLGQELALIMLRHEDSLPAAVADRIRMALRAAADSIIQRNVAMSYTNIAAKGTFVALATGQLLDDQELFDYGRDRLVRLAAIIDGSGSFAEYNSPVYWLVTRTALSAIGQLITDPAVADRADTLVHRLWRHLAARWHRPTGQLTGPMSRTYTDDLADSPNLLATIAKAVAGRVPFDQVWTAPEWDPADAIGGVATAILRADAPAEVVARLLGPAVPELHRELFELGRPDRIGTSWLGRSATLGSINFADCWFQRRNLLGYWAGPEQRTGPLWQQPTPSLRLRVIKDETDFVSGVFSSVQDGPHLLWHVGIASPGGDRHVHRDVIEAGESIMVESIRVRLELRVGPGAELLVDGSPAAAGSRFALGQRITVADQGTMIDFAPTAGGWAETAPYGMINRLGPDRIGLDLILFSAPGPTPIVLSEIGTAFAGGSLSLLEDADGSPAPAPRAARRGDVLDWHWQPRRRLTLTARSTVGRRSEHAKTAATAVGDPA